MEKEITEKEIFIDKSKQQISDSNAVENQNKGHNVKKAALGPNTRR